MTEGRDRRLYDAARRLADLWADSIGPAPKRAWSDGHQGMKIALYRLARLVDDLEGPGAGARYADLADYLLSQRGADPRMPAASNYNYGLGAEYDQSHAPAIEQYRAVGHAVRAVYSYTAMAESAARNDDPQMQSAVLSVWDNLSNRKTYITGGIGSGETAEGFGEDYSLPVNAYCESCSGVGNILFQHRMQLMTGRARHADLYEDTLYNGLLSGIALDGRTFTYTNALDTSDSRYPWHVCPCCVGNIPRALLALPAWTYTVGDTSLHVNLFVGGRASVPRVAGTRIDVVQQTDYPRSGRVRIVLRPDRPARFALHVRDPDRVASELYSAEPPSRGLLAVRVNGERVDPEIVDGYAVLERRWSPGDTVDLELDMPVQRVRAIDRVDGLRGRVALKRGPLVFNVEAADQPLDGELAADAPLEAVFDPDLLGGVMTIRGTWSDGTPLLAIPNYARNNRGGRSMVWIREAGGG